MNEFAARLRRDLAAASPVVAPGVFSPLVGRLAAEAGFTVREAFASLGNQAVVVKAQK